MNFHRLVGALLALAAVLIFVDAGAQSRVLGATWLRSIEASDVDESSPLPQANGAVLIVWPDRRESLDLLARLAQQKALPDGFSMLVLGDAENARRLRAMQPALAGMTWRCADPALLHQIDVGSAPILLGIDAGGGVRWVRSGNPRDALEPWLAAAARWTSQPAPHWAESQGAER